MIVRDPGNQQSGILDRLANAAFEHVLATTPETPEGDWVAALMLVDHNGAIVNPGSVRQFYASPETLEIFGTEALPYFIRQHRAKAICLIATAWWANPAPGKRPSEMPDRREMVYINLITPTEERYLHAPIARDPNLPPELGAFVDADCGLSEESARPPEDVRRRGRSAPLLAAARIALREVNAQ